MRANVLALSQENWRFLSCQGQISCKSLPPSNPCAGSHGKAYCKVAPQSRCPLRTEMTNGEASGAAPRTWQGKEIKSSWAPASGLGYRDREKAAAGVECCAVGQT